MEGEHTPTIIQLILSTDLALIQLKDSLFNSSFFQHVDGEKAPLVLAPSQSIALCFSSLVGNFFKEVMLLTYDKITYDKIWVLLATGQNPKQAACLLFLKAWMQICNVYVCKHN